MRFIVALLFITFSISLHAEKLVLTIVSAQGQDKGKVTIELDSLRAPQHVARITQLAKEGLYDGVVFHRVIEGFMAQTGDVQFGNQKQYDARKVGKGSSSYENLKAEFSDVPFTSGVVGMARSDYIHSANSQFFIMTESQFNLNGQYTVIGKVIDGMQVVDRIKLGARAQGGRVTSPDFIQTATVLP